MEPCFANKNGTLTTCRYSSLNSMDCRNSSAPFVVDLTFKINSVSERRLFKMNWIQIVHNERASKVRARPEGQKLC
jgi:hypothetical protein